MRHAPEIAQWAVKPTLLADFDDIARLEYLLQFTLFTTELHVQQTHRLQSKLTEKDFFEKAKAMKGPVATCVVDMTRMHPRSTSDSILREQAIHFSGIDIGLRQAALTLPEGCLEPPVGFSAHPTGVYQYLVFYAALGSSQDFSGSGLQQFLETAIVPAGHSLLSARSRLDPPKRRAFRNLIRLKDTRYQALPMFLLEVEFTPVHVYVPVPLCNLCEKKAAAIFCAPDSAYFCEECDKVHHTDHPLLARHSRCPVQDSDSQFGACRKHLSCICDRACNECMLSLCRQCVLTGDHSRGDKASHNLVPIRDVYNGALATMDHPFETLLPLRQYLRSKTDSYIRNANAQLPKISKAVNAAEHDLMKAIDKKMLHLRAVKAQILTERVTIEWLSSFLRHVLLGMNQTDFLSVRNRHSKLISWLYALDRQDGPPSGSFLGAHYSESNLLPASLRATLKVTTGVSVSVSDENRPQVSVSESIRQPSVNLDPSTAAVLGRSFEKTFVDIDPLAPARTSSPERPQEMYSHRHPPRGVNAARILPATIPQSHFALRMAQLLAEFQFEAAVGLIRLAPVNDRRDVIGAVCGLLHGYKLLPEFISRFLRLEISQNLGGASLRQLFYGGSLIQPLLSFLIQPTNGIIDEAENLIFADFTDAVVSIMARGSSEDAVLCAFIDCWKTIGSVTAAGFPPFYRSMMHTVDSATQQATKSPVLGTAMATQIMLSCVLSDIPLHSLPDFESRKLLSSALKKAAGVVWRLPEVAESSNRAMELVDESLQYDLCKLVYGWMKSILGVGTVRLHAVANFRRDGEELRVSSLTGVIKYLLDLESALESGVYVPDPNIVQNAEVLIKSSIVLAFWKSNQEAQQLFVLFEAIL
ncbi:MAG: hypothetical protein KVP17_000719 [Porospora cf. gigantea B]|uniref:uncharacterized protein n=1 Tax=Porospora cf. gigantea B TaxID=2853592 RepID=UPI003571C6B8|nr:MAG: hypothetical protein KVP17_000719 [Porospora cf. gigantea B]